MSKFKLINQTYLKGLDATLNFYVHEITKTELIWIDRKCDNKTFSISFKTIPSNDTGVFHILEHSVLCGSKKYPVKEPFVELLKGSLNTFLNAITFPDKTMYPVSSRNEKDFINLIDVYMDAVFNPNIYTNPNIFYQEGWHYEIDENDKLNVVGVVYGEMKGAYSSVDEIINDKILNMLYKDNTYGYSSGGNPRNIPDLTYEEFIENHQRFYHPSNAKVFLDGTLDIEKVLNHLDDNYFSNYEYHEDDYIIPYVGKCETKIDSVKYGISKDEDINNKAHFVMAKVISKYKDVEKIVGLEVLIDYLASDNTAPLQRKILSEGLAEDVSVGVMNDMLEPFMIFELSNVNESKLASLKDDVRKIINELINEGFDEKGLIASINKLEFKNFEPHEPFGLILAIRALESWLYGGDPSLYLDIKDIFENLRNKINSDYFINLTKEFFLEDDGLAILNVLPSNTLTEEIDAEERERLDAIYASLSEEEIKEIKEKQEKLNNWQQSKDSKAALNTMPKLEKEDLPIKPLWTTYKLEEKGSTTIIYPNVKSDACYISFLLKLKDIKKEDLSALSLISDLLTNLPTKKHNVAELQRQIKTYLGNLSFSLQAASKDLKEADIYLVGNVSFLKHNIDKAISLLREVLLETEFDHLDLVSEIISQSKLRLDQSVVTKGHVFGYLHALSELSSENKANELINGYGLYEYVKEITSNKDYESLISKIKGLTNDLKDLPLTLCVTGEVEDFKIEKLIEGFNSKNEQSSFKYENKAYLNDGIEIPAQISYAILASNFIKEGYEYKGSYKLVAKILSLSYLWNEVRVQGGAYGTGLNISRNGNIFNYSYRDPNPNRSLEIYSKALDYLKSFIEEKEDFSTYLIGTISDEEPLLSPREESSVVLNRYLRNIKYEDIEKERKELLGTTYEDLNEFMNILKAISPSYTVVANKNMLETCKEIKNYLK